MARARGRITREQETGGRTSAGYCKETKSKVQMPQSRKLDLLPTDSPRFREQPTLVGMIYHARVKDGGCRGQCLKVLL